LWAGSVDFDDGFFNGERFDAQKAAIGADGQEK
jgi:hypothetical protein